MSKNEAGKSKEAEDPNTLLPESDDDSEFEDEPSDSYHKMVVNHQQYARNKQEQFDTWKSDVAKRREKLMKSFSQMTLTGIKLPNETASSSGNSNDQDDSLKTK